MKKFLLVSALLLSTNTFASNIYCPQSISCTNQGCSGIPQNFYISSGTPAPNSIYYFREAIATPGMQVREPCIYETNSGKTSSKIALGSRQRIQADTRYHGNQWTPTGGGLLACMYDANNCPFK